MSRRDTIRMERWRVQVRSQYTGRVTHESTFPNEKLALDYFNSLGPALGTRELQHRAAGEQRFVTVIRKPQGAT